MLITRDAQTGQYAWRANLETLDDYINDIMEFPTQFDNTSTNAETLFIGGEKSNYIKY